MRNFRKFRLPAPGESGSEDLCQMVSQIDPQPWSEPLWLALHFGLQRVKIDPTQGFDFGRIRSDLKPDAGFGHENIDQFVFDQPAPDIGAVFDLTGKGWDKPGDPQFFAQAPHRAKGGVFLPQGMGAAGVRPKAST